LAKKVIIKQKFLSSSKILFILVCYIR